MIRSDHLIDDEVGICDACVIRSEYVHGGRPTSKTTRQKLNAVGRT